MSSLTAAALCIALLAFVPATTAYSCNKASGIRKHGPCTEVQSDSGNVLEELQLSSSASCSAPCQSAPDHSSVTYCIADVHQACDYSQNQKCPACGIYKKVVQAEPCKFVYSPQTIPANTSLPHWIIMPCKPVSGIESILDNTQATSTNFLWAQAWTDASRGLNNRLRLPKSQIGLVMNSFFYRSQHQMHIHMARLQQEFVQDCLNTLPAKFQDQFAYPNGTQCKFQTLSKFAKDLTGVNTLVQAGATQVEARYGIPATKVAALVTRNLSKSYKPFQGYIVTVFVGNDHHGDHDILNYS